MGLPLLGGRLWGSDELGRLSEDDWIGLVVERVVEHRRRPTPLRRARARALVEEDRVRIMRDIEEVTARLLHRLGLRSVERSPVEQELVHGVASVTEATPGVPKVGGVWIGVRLLGRRVSPRGNQYQRFLYREFLSAWLRAGN